MACTTLEAALAFISEHGVVLVSARGAIPCLTQAIVGEPIKGSWWGHPQGKLIFSLLEAVTESGQVLVCRLVDGKLTMVHRRLWPALASIAPRFAPEQIASIRQEHTASGRHVNQLIAFPDWVPADVLEQAAGIDQADAVARFRGWLASA